MSTSLLNHPLLLRAGEGFRVPNEGIHTMNKRTIPDIAEELRAHINTDNDAKRLICEHVLPLVGIEVDTVTELEELAKTPANYDEFVDDMRADLDDLIEDFSGKSNNEILHELKRIRGTFV
jgi:hypothetical protein